MLAQQGAGLFFVVVPNCICHKTTEPRFYSTLVLSHRTQVKSSSVTSKPPNCFWLATILFGWGWIHMSNTTLFCGAGKGHRTARERSVGVGGGTGGLELL